MEFTGERYMPTVGGDIKYEHLHRYALALQFVAGKSVLDIASGEGYGAALLASAAGSVTGVDVDHQAVSHASERYKRLANLTFQRGSCDSTPLSDHSVDVVTSFETIEHHDRHQEMMREIKRVLRPDGLLILSSPNKTVYTEQRNHSNEYHIKELYFEELVDLLRPHFRRIELYGQRMAIGSVIYTLREQGEEKLQSFSGTTDRIASRMSQLENPVYFIAFCSDREIGISPTGDSIFFDPQDDLYQSQFDLLNSWRRQLESLHHEVLAARARDAEYAAREHALRIEIERADQITQSRAWRWVERLRKVRAFMTMNGKQTVG